MTKTMTRDEALDFATDHYFAGNIAMLPDSLAPTSEIEEALAAWDVTVVEEIPEVSAPVMVPAYATSWIGTTHTVPVLNFSMHSEAAFYDVQTPAGLREVWVQHRPNQVTVNVYDADPERATNSRLFTADVEDGKSATDAAAEFLTKEWV